MVNAPENSQPFKSFEELLKFTYSRTPCEVHPEDCSPREVGHVVWDADDTIWDIRPYGIASYCQPPFTKLDEDTLQTQSKRGKWSKRDRRSSPNFWYTEGDTLEDDSPYSMLSISDCRVVLKKGLVETIKRLKEKGIGSSIASSNNPGSVQAILDNFGIKELFDSIQSNWATKPEMVKKISKETGVPTAKMIFVDDSIGNGLTVRETLGTLSLTMGQDIQSPEEVLAYIKEK